MVTEAAKQRQADTFEGANETLAGFSPILARLQARAAAFDRPVLLLHSYVEDHPLPMPGLTRIVVEGSDLGRREYLRLRIDRLTAALQLGARPVLEKKNSGGCSRVNSAAARVSVFQPI